MQLNAKRKITIRVWIHLIFILKYIIIQISSKCELVNDANDANGMNLNLDLIIYSDEIKIQKKWSSMFFSKNLGRRSMLLTLKLEVSVQAQVGVVGDAIARSILSRITPRTYLWLVKLTFITNNTHKIVHKTDFLVLQTSFLKIFLFYTLPRPLCAPLNKLSKNCTCFKLIGKEGFTLEISIRSSISRN